MAAPRSPNYPRTGLAGAIEDIGKIWRQDGKNKITSDAALRHMGYKSLNGAAQVALSVLRKYGLLEDKNGKVYVSDTAVDILEGRNNPEVYRKALRKAAFLPPLFQELRRDFPETLPSADALRFHLIKKGFNADAASRAAKSFRETMELVTASGATYTDNGEALANADSAGIAVGDLVQWESQGALQFAPPRRVLSLSEDGQFAFVEGSLTGLPVDELTREEGEEPPMQGQGQTPNAGAVPPPAPRSAPPMPPAPPLAPLREGFKQDVYSLPEGDVVLRWPEGLSKDNFADLQDWLEVIQRKIARAIGAEPRSEAKK